MIQVQGYYAIACVIFVTTYLKGTIQNSITGTAVFDYDTENCSIKCKNQRVTNRSKSKNSNVREFCTNCT